MSWKDFEGLTLAGAVDRTAARYADKEAIVFGAERISYSELKRQTVRLAKALLKSGVKRGDKVAIMMTNRPEWIYARDAAVRVGAWWVPVNTRYKTMELEFLLRHAEIHTIFIADQAVNIDFAGLLNRVCPEIGESDPGRIRSKTLPNLRNVICLSDKFYPGMFRFQDFLAYGEGVAEEDLERATRLILPDDVANITYTSGTTGDPKGVLTTHAQFLHAMSNMAERFETTAEDCVLLAAPLFTNIGNLTGLIQAEMFGAKMALFETFDPREIIRGIEAEKCSIFTGTPAMFTMIMEHESFTPQKVASMRTGIIGGAPVTAEMVRNIQQKIDMKIFSAYGMTENSAITTMNEIDDTPELVANTSGRLLHKDCGMRIVDPETGKELPPGQQGEIRTRGWFVTQGYYKNPQATAESLDSEGWYRTGDLGVIDDKGYLKVTGRLKDLIISGGLNIDPVEIEGLLAQHPAVAAAQVVGLPDHRMGEVVGAFLKLKPGSELAEGAIQSFCAEKIGKYKIPKYLMTIDEFPMTAAGKIQKFKLREMAVERFGLSDDRKA